MTTLDLLIFEWRTVVTASVVTVGFISAIIWVYNNGMDE
jgi:hypothetical protein